MAPTQMNTEEIAAIQKQLGLSDSKMAAALHITRQTWRNWRTGRKCPEFAQCALRWMMELRRLDHANDNLPDRIKAVGLMALLLIGLPEFASEF